MLDIDSFPSWKFFGIVWKFKLFCWIWCRTQKSQHCLVITGTKKKVLISYLEDDVYRLFEKAILNKEENGLTFHKVNIEVNTSNIKEIKVIENVAYIRVEFDFSEGVLIKNSDGTVFSDNADAPKDRNVTWTFARALNSDNPNWKLFAANQVD